MTDLTTTRQPGSGDEPATSRLPEGHSWQEAGAAWGRRALDWACFFEHYATDTTQAIFERLDVADGSSLLDIACGSGLALRYARARGARVAGIDAAEALVELAASRNPDADIRLGTMFDLPWDDHSFDAVTSINGIWGGCEAAVAEAYRVLRPGGRIGISFWGGTGGRSTCGRASRCSRPTHPQITSVA
jgi:SAM-dependent methyltransferase